MDEKLSKKKNDTVRRQLQLQDNFVAEHTQNFIGETQKTRGLVEKTISSKATEKNLINFHLIYNTAKENHKSGSESL